MKTTKSLTTRILAIGIAAALSSCSETAQAPPATDAADPVQENAPSKAGTGTVTPVDAKQYREILDSESRLVIADFHADWCGPCKMIAPSLEKIASKYPDTTRVIKVDVDANGDLAGSLGIRSIPFVQFYKGGKAVGEFIGVRPYEGIVEMVESHLAKK